MPNLIINAAIFAIITSLLHSSLGLAQQSSSDQIQIRKLNKSLPWPDLTINVKSAFQSEAQYNSMSHIQKLQQIETYCQETARDYAAKVKKELPVKGLAEYFVGTCETLSFKLRKSNDLHSFSNIKNVDALLQNQLDTAFSYIYNQPFTDFWKAGEEYLSQYKASIMGVLGVPIRYYFNVIQILVLSSLLMSLATFLKR